jgi:pyruvate/2-oxoglutarate/acetoin dehydrogenase E1 component
MREWILQSAIAPAAELDRIEKESALAAREAKARAWEAFQRPIREEKKQAVELLDGMRQGPASEAVAELARTLSAQSEPVRKDIAEAVRQALLATAGSGGGARRKLADWLRAWNRENSERFDSLLYSDSPRSALRVEAVEPAYAAGAPEVDGREVLLANWDAQLARLPGLHIFGEDVGRIGGVNQTFAGLQQKYGAHRVVDTGIREMTIVGQGIGMALRGLRPVAEIQYLDYLVYALTALSDDLACLHYRTRGGQKAPLIVSTRGHRLEGVWHSGSPMQMLLGSLRGMHLFVPRNMTQAAGFYNTLLASDDPALVIEPLNAYRAKERLPSNPGEYRLPLGRPDVLTEGEDLTLVTYGSCVRLALAAEARLRAAGIGTEVIDVQTLLPFDTGSRIAASLEKTNKILFVDEDVPGGGTAYLLQQVLEAQNGFRHLDAEPVTLPARAHRPAYGTDGDYFSKPGVEDIVEAAWGIMHRYDPARFPSLG